MSPVGKLIIFSIGLVLLFRFTERFDRYVYDGLSDEIISRQQYRYFLLLIASIKAFGVSIVIVTLINIVIKILSIHKAKSLNYRLVALIIIMSLVFFFLRDGIFFNLFNPNQYFGDNYFYNSMEVDDFIGEIRLILEIDLETEFSSTSAPISLYFKGIEIFSGGPSSKGYERICFDEIIFSVSGSIDSFHLNPLVGEPKVPKFDYLKDLLEYVSESNFPHTEAPYCYTIEDINDLYATYDPERLYYFEFPEKKNIFNYLYMYVDEYELFNYPYTKKEINYAIQVSYHLENDDTKSEKRVIAPPIEIIYNHTNIWNYESTSIIQQTTPLDIVNPGNYFDIPNWTTGPIKIVQTSISGPTFYKVITIIILVGLYLLTGFLLIIKDDGGFVGAAGAILFGIFGTKQIISPSLSIEHNVIDTTIFFLYIFITMIVIERVILKIVGKLK